VKKSAPAPLEGGHIEWIKQRLLVAGGGEGYQKIAREFLREHAGFACSERSLIRRIRRIWNDMHELRAGAEAEPPRWTAQEDKCLLRLLPQRLGWAHCAAIINTECGSSRTAEGVRKHVAKMEKEKGRRDRKDRKDFDDFMNEILQTPASELDDFINEILQTPASELELFAGSEDETSTDGFMFLSGEDETTGWGV
jgi:hypothetical protein